MDKEKTAEEMAKTLGLNPDRFQTTDKNILDALKTAYDFKINKIATNRTSGYTFYYTDKNNFLKKFNYALLNFISDMFYKTFSIFMLPKNRPLILGDILIIKATKK